MRGNCCFRLLDEIKLSKPDIVVIFGAKERGQVFHHLHNCEKIRVDDLHQKAGLSKREVLCEVPSLRCYFVFLWHPAYNGLDRKWDEWVVPSIRYLKKIGVIPNGYVGSSPAEA
jgi:hypothetical protein